jgi:Carboxypeptidase regulatory-like domain/TonB dependent receptor
MRTISGFVLLAAVLGFGISAAAQTESATLTGRITDQSGAVVTGAELIATNVDTGVSVTTLTNDVGVYAIPGLHPGTYRLTIRKIGFQQIVTKDIVLHVQDVLTQNFDLPLGSVSETVTVTGGAPLINTESASVSTVVDRQFAENLPLNGRSFQTLIQLTPGVVLTANNSSVDIGQFSVNGQRASANYWMVDGVSADVGIGANSPTSNGLAGSVGSFSALGSTNSLVSVDALQEFRIQTSTFAPEFGRTPGGQISIVTRSGTNQFHGAAFDYLRNDVLDANDWFANSKGLPKPRERQNDFGGTFSGPILRDRTFFFFSYEGLRLRLPQTGLTNVPDLNARQNAVPGIQPFLNAYPLPNGPDNVSTGVAQFNGTFANPATLDAYSLRIDHKLSNKWTLFGRYNYSPSEGDVRAFNIIPLSSVYQARITLHTGTAGVTWNISTTAVNDFRFNYSNTNSTNSLRQDNFGGATPLTSLPFPSEFSTQNALLSFVVLSLGSTRGGFIQVGHGATNQQRQINIVDSVSVQERSHSLKFGVDFRRLSPQVGLSRYGQTALFLSVPQAETGKTLLTTLFNRSDVNLLFRNLGVFGQDTWRLSPRLTLTYGLRWDLDVAPSSTSGPSLPAATGFDLSNLSSLGLAPAGTPPYKTTYSNVAPRIGLAYQLSERQNWQTVLRGGFGVFYDLATSEVGNILGSNSFPYGALVSRFGVSFPLSSGTDAPPPITPPAPGTGQLFALDPNLQLPYTFQWNVALEQALGRQQTISASYIGSAGRRLLQTANIKSPNAGLAAAILVTNAATSNYNALQLQFQRRLSRGLQALASYTWSHSIDTASAGSIGNGSNDLTALNPSINRGPSDFDIRNAFSMALTYEVPAPKTNALANAILQGWSTENIFQFRSAPPINVYYSSFSLLSNFATQVRPNVVPGQPFYLSGSQYPGGKALNPAAFSAPPLGTNNLPTAQGSVGRNALRGFGATQWDFAVHRNFPIHESVKLQFRAEMFNVLNHPNFGQPVGDLASPSALNPQFGTSAQMLGQSLGGSAGFGAGAFNPLYQIGGPRSIQFALKLMF